MLEFNNFLLSDLLSDLHAVLLSYVHNYFDRSFHCIKMVVNHNILLFIMYIIYNAIIV